MSDMHNLGVEGYPSTLVHGTTTGTELVEVQRENPGVYLEAMNAVQHDTQRRLVWALVQNDGRVSYNELKTLTNVSERTQRKHVTNLVEQDLINRVDANFTFIEFASFEAEILLRHALSVWYDSTA